MPERDRTIPPAGQADAPAAPSAGQAAPSRPAELDTDPEALAASLTVRELRARCKAAGVSTSGGKHDMAGRLASATAGDAHAHAGREGEDPAGEAAGTAAAKPPAATKPAARPPAERTCPECGERIIRRKRSDTRGNVRWQCPFCKARFDVEDIFPDATPARVNLAGYRG